MNAKKFKTDFLHKLQLFAERITPRITHENSWTIKAFIDRTKNLYAIASDTKIVSKILEIQLLPLFFKFAQKNHYKIELASHQNWYPDLSFISATNHNVKFAVDIKTTYRNPTNNSYCNGLTLGSHGEYFINRNSSKNIQYPYNKYLAHYCFGIIYSRITLSKYSMLKTYNLNELHKISSVAKNLVCFVQEKWRIASDKGGSGNTANIGSVHRINDLINGQGVFAELGEQVFDDYWANYGKLEIKDSKGTYKKLSSLKDYLKYKTLNHTHLLKPHHRRK
ncbi:MAG: EcoRV family type II restriction endonuclease [Bacteriovoracaceae bacterium]|nr:EcoRV family type II restriction endonuclease [Bacteriovoracaceae bacterium]